MTKKYRHLLFDLDGTLTDPMEGITRSVQYALRHFDWQQARSIVVQRVIERGCAEDYFAAFDLYGGIAGFREILREVSTLSDKDMNFVCTFFNLKKEELRCYTRRLLRRKLLSC